MIKYFTRTLALVAAGAISTGLLATPAHATVLLKWNVEELTDNADAVVRVQVADTEVRWTEDRTRIHTHAKLRVVEVLDGNAQVGDTVHVIQVGGVIDGVGGHIAGAPRFENGEEAVMFVEQRTNRAGAQIQDHWLVTGLFQGKFAVQVNEAGHTMVQRANRMSGVMLVETTGTEGAAVQEPAETKMTLEELRTRVKSFRKRVGAKAQGVSK